MSVCCRTSTGPRIAEAPEIGPVLIAALCDPGAVDRQGTKLPALPTCRLNVFSALAVVPLGARTAHQMPEVFGDPAQNRHPKPPIP